VFAKILETNFSITKLHFPFTYEYRSMVEEIFSRNRRLAHFRKTTLFTLMLPSLLLDDAPSSSCDDPQPKRHRV